MFSVRNLTRFMLAIRFFVFALALAAWVQDGPLFAAVIVFAWMYVELGDAHPYLAWMFVALTYLCLTAVIFDLRLAPYPGGWHHFEDGSFILGRFAGCVPHALCDGG